jgi:hypothetical protein
VARTYVARRGSTLGRDRLRRVAWALFPAAILVIPAGAAAPPVRPPLADRPVGMRECDVQEHTPPIYSTAVRGAPGIRLDLRQADEGRKFVLVVKSDGPGPCDGVVASVLALPDVPDTPDTPDTHEATATAPRWYIEF